MYPVSSQKHKQVRMLQKNQVSLKESECTVDDLKEVRTAQLGVDEGVLRELLRLGVRLPTIIQPECKERCGCLAPDVHDYFHLNTRLEDEEKLESFFIADDPEIRKAARRLKLERRMQQATLPQEEQEPVKVPTESEIQMESSMLRILELLEDGRKSVSSIQVTTVQNAIERQKKEREQRDEIDRIVKDECEKAQSMFEEIDNRWKEISKNQDILTLYDETHEQKADCTELLEQKDIFIANLKSRLRRADRQFNEELAKQDDFLNILSERINDQISVMNDCYQRELQNLQNVVNVEKAEILDERKKQWEKMVGAKERLELENAVKRYDYLQEYEEQIDSMLIEQHETMRDQKMIIETKLNKLTVEENRYQSAVLISKELLNYNVQVLQKRQDENRVIKGQQKRIVNRLQDSVRKLRQEQKNEIERLVNEKKQLQEGIKNLHRNVNTLNVRLKNLAASSTKKYFQLWDFNQGVAEELIDKLVKADKKFHTSLLCVSWHVPAVDFSRKQLPSYVEARALIKEAKGKGSTNDSWPDMEKRDMEKLFSLVLDSIQNKTEFLIDDTLKILLEPLNSTSKTLITINSLFNALGMREKDDIEYMSKFFLPYVVCKLCEKSENDEETYGESQEVTPSTQPTPEIVSERLKKQFAMTNQVIKEEFCTRGAILNLVTGDDELIVRENDPRDEDILRKHEILGTEVDPSQLPILAQKTPSKICEPDPRENQQEKVAGKLRRLETLMCSKPGHRPAINPNLVSKALNEFVTKLNEERKSKELISLKEILTQKTLTESRLLSKVDVETFWGGFKTVFSEKKKIMWKCLLTQMKVCYKILLRRHHINEAVKNEEKRNEELRRLVSKYIDAGKHGNAWRILEKLPPPYRKSAESLSLSDDVKIN